MPVIATKIMSQNDALSKDFVNNYILSPINSIANPPSAFYTKPSSDPNLTTTSTTFTYLDNTLNKFYLQISTSGNPVIVGFRSLVQHSVAANSVAFDIEVDGVNYTGGGNLAVGNHSVAGGSFMVAFSEVIQIASGVHTFKVVWRAVTAGTATLVSSSIPSFYVKEL